jgi:hypothetical protein
MLCSFLNKKSDVDSLLSAVYGKLEYTHRVHCLRRLDLSSSAKETLVKTADFEKKKVHSTHYPVLFSSEGLKAHPEGQQPDQGRAEVTLFL